MTAMRVAREKKKRKSCTQWTCHKHHMAEMSESSLQKISEEKPLNDECICFAQKLLQQFPILNGLQSPLLSQNNGFCPVTSESIQIHHTGQFHWVTLFNIGGNIQLYDSRFKGGDFSSSLQVELMQIYKTRITKEHEEDGYKFLKINVTAVQLQQEVKDYGVFAIAFACHAARGDNLSNIKFQQKKMRQHL